MKISLLDILRQWSSVSRHMIFIEDDGFQRRCKGLLDDEELGAMMDWLAARPDAGKVIPGSGGMRKLRWAAKGHGKRGGALVIYFWWMADDKILLLDIYAKGKQEDLSDDEIEKLKRKTMP
jgi:hypothetical protein